MAPMRPGAASASPLAVPGHASALGRGILLELALHRTARVTEAPRNLPWVLSMKMTTSTSVSPGRCQAMPTDPGHSGAQPSSMFCGFSVPFLMSQVRRANG